MDNYLQIILLIVASFILTGLARWFLIRGKIVDIPNERSSHDSPTPRGGGIALVILWFATLVFLTLNELIPRSLFWALLSGSVIAAMSFIDDLNSVKPSYRIIAQFISVSLALYFLTPVLPVHFEIFTIGSSWILVIMAIIGGIWFINLFNFLDGIDGYAAMEAIIVALAIYLFVRSELLLLFIAINIGFLIWNWPKAKIFMGDIGSTQLGFVLYVLGIYYHNTGELDIFFWLAITSLFWFDAVLTLCRRIRNRENLSKAHKKHAYQRIVQSGFSHQKTLVLASLINFIIIFVVFVSINRSYKPIIILLVIVLLNYGLNRLVDIRKPFPGNRM